MTESFETTRLNRVRQYQSRAQYDRKAVFDILDRGLVAHVAFVHEGRPIVIPMTYGRDGDRLFLHGSTKARILTATNGSPVCIGVTLIDGIVVARSMFDASMNYRAVVVHGQAVELCDASERLHAMRCISEHNLPGRWDEVRPLDAQEIKATAIIEVAIESASAKIREGPPSKDDEVDQGVWSGVLPVVTTFGSPIADATVPDGVPLPASIHLLRESERIRRA
jgi:uncharacterized protein